MKIWVDADACPVAIKDVLYRASERTGINITLVANQPLRTPAIKTVHFLQVQSGFDVADNRIVELVEAGDLVITSDIPLANDVIEKGAQVLSPRGERFTANEIKARLNVRDFMETMRASGVHTGGPAALSQQDRRNFANYLDQILTRFLKGKT